LVNRDCLSWQVAQHIYPSQAIPNTQKGTQNKIAPGNQTGTKKANRKKPIEREPATGQVFIVVQVQALKLALASTPCKARSRLVLAPARHAVRVECVLQVNAARCSSTAIKRHPCPEQQHSRSKVHHHHHQATPPTRMQNTGFKCKAPQSIAKQPLRTHSGSLQATKSCHMLLLLCSCCSCRHLGYT
jgi:hypothetical protein